MTAELDGTEGLSDTLATFIEGVRAFLRDYPQLNRLTDGVETSTGMIAHAAAQMLADFAGTPPNLGWFELTTLINERYMYSHCLIGTAYFVLLSVLNHYKRNELPFNDGGLAVQTDGLIPHVERQMAMYKRDWDQAKRDIKISMNIDYCRGVDSPGSEYQRLSTWVTCPVLRQFEVIDGYQLDVQESEE